jgi:hypothetical protein
MNITSTRVKDGVLFLCSNNKIYTLTKKDTDIEAYWTTLEDEFKYPQYYKSTNKKGCVVDCNGDGQYHIEEEYYVQFCKVVIKNHWHNTFTNFYQYDPITICGLD